MKWEYQCRFSETTLPESILGQTLDEGGLAEVRGRSGRRQTTYPGEDVHSVGCPGDLGGVEVEQVQHQHDHRRDEHVQTGPDHRHGAGPPLGKTGVTPT